MGGRSQSERVGGAAQPLQQTEEYELVFVTPNQSDDLDLPVKAFNPWRTRGHAIYVSHPEVVAAVIKRAAQGQAK